jgi:hypothetical protein
MSLLGLPIGFYGYLFPGNINIMVMDLYNLKKYKVLFLILVLVLVFESIYCFFSLHYINKLRSSTDFFTIIELIAYLLILSMGLWMLWDAKSKVKIANKNNLYRGILSIIVHPQQISFWIVMGIVINPFFNSGLEGSTLLGFLFFNAVGTLLIMSLYMVYGNKLLQYFKFKIHQLNTLVGVFFILLGLFSLANMIISVG